MAFKQTNMNYFLFTYDKHENGSIEDSVTLQENLIALFKTLNFDKVDWCASTTFIFSTTKSMDDIEVTLNNWREEIYYTLAPIQLNRYNKPIWQMWRNENSSNNFQEKYYPEKD